MTMIADNCLLPEEAPPAVHLLQGDGGRRLGSCGTWIWPGVRRSAALRASGATSFGPGPWQRQS